MAIMLQIYWNFHTWKYLAIKYPGFFFFIKNRAGKGYISESLKTSPVNEQKSVITVWGTVHIFKVVICCLLFLTHISEVTATHIIGAPDFQHCETVECCDL